MHSSLEICPIVAADDLGIQHFLNIPSKEELGQFFTPVDVAEFMAKLLETPSKKSIQILDPGAGTGILAAASIKELVNRENSKIKEINLILYEIDKTLEPTLNASMTNLADWCSQIKVKLTFEIRFEDFILARGSLLQDQPFFGERVELFDVVISNPPYFKISKDDPRAIACSSIVHGQPNIYALFMGVSASLLGENGQFLFITPRSFASGQYFKTFRDYLMGKIRLKRIHQFASRKDTFARDQVLQENIIFYGKMGESQVSDKIQISTSNGRSDLNSAKIFETHLSDIFIDPVQRMIALPRDKKDLDLLNIFKKWTNSIEKMGLKISTGPVVPFRATEFLQKTKDNKSCPLLWIQHVAGMKVIFPLENFRKQQWFSSVEESKKLLVKNQNMILMRRFSPKEDFRRLTVAPLRKELFSDEYLGLENHLNYIYRPNGKFDEFELLGLTGFLSSKVFDSYFRITNGNTQVSATEIKSVRLPETAQISEIGRMLKSLKEWDYSSVDAIVEEVLRL